MKIIKKNQLTILVLALMLVTAGYLNYNSSIQTGTEVASIGDATLVSTNLSNSISNNTKNQVINNDMPTTNEKIETEVASSVSTTEESIVTNSEATSTEEYFTSSRLERYTKVVEWDHGYLVVMAKYKHNEKPEEEYIDLVPILKNLYFDADKFLSPIKGVEVVNG